MVDVEAIVVVVDVAVVGFVVFVGAIMVYSS